MKRAHRSYNGKFAVCGGCRASLCRRDWRDRGAAGVGYFLVWGDEWRKHPDGCLERIAGAAARRAQGRAPSRYPWLNADRLELSRELLRLTPGAEHPPVRCDACEEINSIEWKRLGVSGVAPA